MTRDEIKELAEGCLDGEAIDDDVFDALATDAKDEIEGLRNWEFLKALDETQSASAASKPLPDDYRSTLLIYVGSSTRPHNQIPFEQKLIFANGSNCWYLDFKNNVYYVIGGTGTIHHFYLYQTPEISAELDAGPVWPDRFHKLLAFRIAEKAYPVMQEERGLSWDDKWRIAGDVVLASMIRWDVQQQRKGQANGLSEVDLDDAVGVSLGDM